MNIKLNLGEIIMRQKNQNKKRRYNIKQHIEITYYETNERVNIVETKRISLMYKIMCIHISHVGAGKY